MLEPITFQCRQPFEYPAEAIMTVMTDVSRWSEFSGYGPLPGIAGAVYETRTADMVGSRIRVTNTDGSSHVEEIIRWVPGAAVAMKMHEFTPPLSRLATHFIEEWTFETRGPGTLVTRRLQLYPRSAATWPFLWLISLLLRRAIARSLKEMAGGGR